MEHDKPQETTSFMPVIPRLDRLDRLLYLLEEKHSLSRRDFSVATKENGEKECKTLSLALEEVQHKGTLMERLTMLENRVLQLSMEMDEGNTSKSSSSTVQAPEKTGKESESSIQEMQAQEGVSCTPGFVREGIAEHKSRGQKRKTTKKWLWLFRLRC
ncbi:hypothetical protein CDL12_26764 [Handroanthus impetiginosus]|uniref:Uncharacterized protein n=1 Tax=Handroanthus impetiginosus TaxID=429701 RepID=A0A2G9G5Z5_9LAMI|nr:hypothetical protein CDL12_26764 [Handroanthus impetiginosus]